MGSVTLEDLELGLSITTVSRALGGHGDVAEATRQRVLQTAEAMGYVPDATAHRLKEGRSDTIGFVIPAYAPRPSDPSFGALLASIGNEAARHSFDLLVSTSPPHTPEERDTNRRMTEGYLVDGLPVVRTRVKDSRTRYVSQLGLPFVAFGRPDPGIDFPYVDEDRYIYGLLIRSIQGEEVAKRRVLLQPKLMIRESSGARWDEL